LIFASYSRLQKPSERLHEIDLVGVALALVAGGAEQLKVAATIRAAFCQRHDVVNVAFASQPYSARRTRASVALLPADICDVLGSMGLAIAALSGAASSHV